MDRGRAGGCFGASRAAGEAGRGGQAPVRRGLWGRAGPVGLGWAGESVGVWRVELVAGWSGGLG